MYSRNQHNFVKIKRQICKSILSNFFSLKNLMTLVGEESGLEDSEPEQKRKKIEDSSGRSVAPDVPEDFLVPKAGFVCPICSLFYSDEKAMTNHCKSTRHKQNTEVSVLSLTPQNLQVLLPQSEY